MFSKINARHLQHGASLLEVLIAVLVLSVGLIGALKMQSEAVRQNANARYVSQAGIHAMQIMETIKSGTATATDITNWQELVSADLPGGTGTAALSGTQYTITVKWTPPGTGKQEEAVYALDTRN